MPRSTNTMTGNGKSKPLISHSTILILSGFLLGMVIGDVVDPRLERFVLLGSAFGVVAYFGLRMVARNRRELLDRLSEQEARHEVENRLIRHLPRPSRVRRDETAQIGCEEGPQYLAVTKTSRLKSFR